MEERLTHVSDEQLIAHLDGELTAAEHAEVRQHLKNCWQCRTRAMQFQDQVRLLSESWANQTYLPPAEVERSRERCRRTIHGPVREMRRQIAATPSFYLQPRSLGWRLAAAGVVLIAALIGGRYWTSAPPVPLADPAAQLAQSALHSDTELLETPGAVHQVIRVEVAELRPVNRRRISRLDVWSNPPEQRAALRWNYPSSGLRYAHWQSGDRSFAYNPAEERRIVASRPRSAAVAFLSELPLHGIDVYQLEAAFLGWLQTKDWRAIELSKEFAEFASADGVRVRVEQSPETARLIAERGGSGDRSTAVLELDRRSNRPRFASLRFERDGQAAEFRLVMESETILPPDMVPAAAFTPVIPGRVASLPRKAVLPVPHDSPAQVVEPAPPLLPGARDLDVLEVEVWYLLHRIGVCLGEPVEVRRTESGIDITGAFASESRRQQVAATLAEFDGHPWVRSSLELAEMPEATGEIAEGIIVSAPGPVYLDEYLTRRFRSRQESNTFLNDVVSSSKSQLAEAWALRRLAERFSRLENLPLSRRSLIESMAEDHLDALHHGLRHLHRQLQLPQSASASVPASESPRDWREACHTVFEQAHALHRLVMALFAGDSLPAGIYGSASGEPGLTAPSQAAALEALLDALSSGESSLAITRSLVRLRLASPAAGPGSAIREEGNNP